MSALCGRSHGTRVLPKVFRLLFFPCCEVLCSPARCPPSESYLKLFPVSALFLITMAAELDEALHDSAVSEGRGGVVRRLTRCHGGRFLLMGSDGSAFKQDVERSFCWFVLF